MKETQGAVPPQVKGAKSDVSYAVNASDDTAAAELYQKARKNLLDINRWQSIAGKLSAAFILTDPFGKPVQRLPLQGDYVRINLPSSSDDKFEWVRIEALEEKHAEDQLSSIVMRVRPSDPPRQQEETEHFFSQDATSSFIVERKGTKVQASVRGRNELPNLEPGGLMNKLRNLLISIGAMAGMNHPQWNGLVHGILNK